MCLSPTISCPDVNFIEKIDSESEKLRKRHKAKLIVNPDWDRRLVTSGLPEPVQPLDSD
jgi:hypothetical protein